MAPVSPDPSLDGESRVASIQAVLYVGSILSTLVVALRLYIRLSVLKTFGREDAVMAAAQLLTIGSAVAIGLESRWGLGTHVWTIDLANAIPYMKSFYSSVVVYNVATCLVKISILFQYRRIFAGTIIQLLTLIGLIFESLWAVTLSILLPLVCLPVAKFWDPTIEGRCVNQLAIWYVMAGINLATDFIVFTMPLPVIKNLHLPMKQKVMLFFVFCLGFCPCVISIVRVRTLSIAANTDDPTWDNTDAAIWSFIELFLAIMAACLPTLKPLLAKVLPRLFRSTISSSKPSFGNYGPGLSYSSKPRSRQVPSQRKLTRTDSTEELRLDKLNAHLRVTSVDMDRDNHYHVSISGGGDDSWSGSKSSRYGSPERENGSENQITQTTRVTQRVELRKDEPGARTSPKLSFLSP